MERIKKFKIIGLRPFERLFLWMQLRYEAHKFFLFNNFILFYFCGCCCLHFFFSYFSERFSLYFAWFSVWLAFLVNQKQALIELIQFIRFISIYIIFIFFPLRFVHISMMICSKTKERQMNERQNRKIDDISECNEWCILRRNGCTHPKSKDIGNEHRWSVTEWISWSFFPFLLGPCNGWE